ncbi:MAG: AI-2E family transporter [Actinomycetota bacterium]|nr:AI-2E family transporter [Actinomycetota bacterium]
MTQPARQRADRTPDSGGQPGPRRKALQTGWVFQAVDHGDVRQISPSPNWATEAGKLGPDEEAAIDGEQAQQTAGRATSNAAPVGTEPASQDPPDASKVDAFHDAATVPEHRDGDAAGIPAAATAAVGGAPAGQVAREEVPWLVIWTAIGVVLAAAAAIELIVALQRVIELVVIASFLAVVLSPAVSVLVRLKLRRGLATAIVFFAGMAAFGGLAYLFIHPLYQEAVRFANDLPATLARVEAGKGRIGNIIAHYHLQKDAATYIPKIRNYLSHLGGPALSVARTVLSGLGGLIIMSIITFLLLLEGPSLVKGTLRVLPPVQSRRVRRILDDVAKSVTGYVIGNFATSVIAGVVCCVALIALRVPFAIVFGVWVALVDLLPLVGGLLAGVPTVAFAFLYSPAAGIITLIVFLVYQQVENHVLNPLIMSRTVKLNPLWVLLSVLAGAELAGFVGALLAIPAAGTIHVIARDIWDERRGRLKSTPTVGPDETPIH